MEGSRSKDWNLESKIDFYKRQALAEKDSLQRHTYDNKENQTDNKGWNEHLNYGYKWVLPSHLHRTIKMYNIPHDEFGEDEGFESETPEASNEHQEEDTRIQKNIERMMNVNRMEFVNQHESKGSFTVDGKECGQMLNYHRSKSQNKQTIEYSMHPKSQISSPNEASWSTIRNPISHPEMFQKSKWKLYL